MSIEEIQRRMAAIIAAADARDPEQRSLTDEEITQYEGLEKQLAGARKDAELRKRHIAYTTPVTDPVVQTGNRETNDEQERAFEAYLRTGQRNMDLVEVRAQGTESDAAGGILAPDGFRAKLIERRKRYGGILNAVEVITTANGNPLPWPTVDDTANEGEIVAEHAKGSNGADVVFGTHSLGAYRYTSLGASDEPLRVSVELLQDSAFDIVGLITRLLGKRIARKQAKDAVIGTGTSQPDGIANGTGDVFLASGATITYADLLNIVHGVDPDYREGASWGFSDGTLKTLRGLKDDNQRPLWLPSTGGIADALPGGTLMGYPVVIDQAFPALQADVTGQANEPFAVFGDLTEAYVWRNVRDVVLVVDPYRRAEYGEVCYTAWARADGTVQNPNAYVKVAAQDVA